MMREDGAVNQASVDAWNSSKRIASNDVCGVLKKQSASEWIGLSRKASELVEQICCWASNRALQKVTWLYQKSVMEPKNAGSDSESGVDRWGLTATQNIHKFQFILGHITATKFLFGRLHLSDTCQHFKIWGSFSRSCSQTCSFELQL